MAGVSNEQNPLPRKGWSSFLERKSFTLRTIGEGDRVSTHIMGNA